MKYKFKLKVLITLISLISIIFPINVASASESDNYAYNAIGQYGKLGTSNAGYEFKFTDAPGRGDNPGVAYIGAPDPEKVVNVISTSKSSESFSVQTGKVNCEDGGKIWDSTTTILWNAQMDSVTYLDCDQFTIYKSLGYDFTEKPIIDVTPGVSSTKARVNQGILTLTLSTSSKSFPFSQALTLSTTGGSGSGSLTYSVSNGTATGCSLSSNSSSTTITASTAGTCSIIATKGQDADYNSTNSIAVSFTFSALAPNAVTSLTATPGNTTCALSWTAGSANGADITDYTIEYSTDGTNYTTFADGTSTATTATVTGLTNLTAYTLRVTAVNSIGSGSSTTVSCTPTA
jgi:hypothetical protein